jgi:type II secretory pathway predicted ATPase ExeA
MYEAFYGMSHTPFSRDVPPDALYESQAMADALGRLAYAADRQLFAVVTADAGCGKSTLIRKFSACLSKEEYIFLYLSDSKLTPRWFYKGLLDQLGLEARFYRGDAKRQLQKEIEIIRGVHGQRVVCVLDEAHLLEKETIEEFRFLLNYRFDSMSPMALILVGQTELWDEKLRLKRYDAVRQRIDINCVLPHLDRAETEKYIQSHLSYAGVTGRELFSRRAVDEIFRISSGIPRIVNRVCEKALMYGCQQSLQILDDQDILYVSEHEMLRGGESV